MRATMLSALAVCGLMVLAGSAKAQYPLYDPSTGYAVTAPGYASVPNVYAPVRSVGPRVWGPGYYYHYEPWAYNVSPFHYGGYSPFVETYTYTYTYPSYYYRR